jgi:hypothetical protein
MAEWRFSSTYVCDTSRNDQCTVEENGKNLLFKSRCNCDCAAVRYRDSVTGSYRVVMF